MKLRHPLIYSFGVASLLVATSWLAIGVGPESVADRFRMVIFPGSIIDSYLGGNVHQGFGGIMSVIVTSFGSAIVWTIPLWLLFEFLRLLLTRKKNEEA